MIVSTAEIQDWMREKKKMTKTKTFISLFVSEQKVECDMKRINAV